MVELRLMQRPNDKSLYYEVLVASEVMAARGLKLKGIQEFEKEPAEITRQRLGLLAGALAEELCARYSDTLEPSACAKAIMESHRELMAEHPHVNWGDEAPRAADRSISTGVARH